MIQVYSQVLVVVYLYKAFTEVLLVECKLMPDCIHTFYYRFGYKGFERLIVLPFPSRSHLFLMSVLVADEI